MVRRARVEPSGRDFPPLARRILSPLVGKSSSGERTLDNASAATRTVRPPATHRRVVQAFLPTAAAAEAHLLFYRHR
ncbi:hypothetical protein KCP73_02760 [Salmonella enterica subsp. enterica]|nr:hypothetical protein KCP73_02760 [Salmonella enterica subsp. enterica]